MEEFEFRRPIKKVDFVGHEGWWLHWNFLNRKESDIVMTSNEEGVYEADTGCPICNVLTRRSHDK